MSPTDKDRIASPTRGPLAANEKRVESRDSHGVVNDGWIVAECSGPDGRANAVEIAARWNLIEEVLSGKCGALSKAAIRILQGGLALHRMANTPKPTNRQCGAFPSKPKSDRQRQREWDATFESDEEP